MGIWRLQVSYQRLTPAFPSRSGEGNEFGIFWAAIGSNVVLSEPSFGVEPPGLIEADLTISHNLLYFSFGLLIQASASITSGDVGRQIEIARCEARFDVAEEGRRETGVDVLWEGQLIDRNEMDPSIAGEVKGWGKSLSAGASTVYEEGWRREFR